MFYATCMRFVGSKTMFARILISDLERWNSVLIDFVVYLNPKGLRYKTFNTLNTSITLATTLDAQSRGPGFKSRLSMGFVCVVCCLLSSHLGLKQCLSL